MSPFILSDADQCSHLSPKNKDKLMDYLHIGEAESSNTVTYDTHDDKKETHGNDAQIVGRSVIQTQSLPHLT